MPELPEVETIRRELERDIVGLRIKEVEVNDTRSIRRHGKKAPFVKLLDGAKVTHVHRRGKYLVLNLDTGSVLVIHLGMSGQLRRNAPKDPTETHTRVVLTFTQKGQLRFIDPRKFGEMFVVPADAIADEVPELAHLGFDPVDQAVSWTSFGQAVVNRSVKLKPLLMDQKFIAGIGNIYADEILHGAGLRPDRLSNSLSTQEIRRLYRALVETLHDAIKYGGSTLSDGQYVDLHGKPGEYQEHHQVYDREGKDCRRCRAPIVRIKANQRSTFYCEQCQV
ncbi:MAG TPA: bifunctional DNA-formamidopyrimidine glycosylase/DNA-(apurinic or apyrimidinic site) lyase [Acidimicrobiales bacterium]|nr:bifunctional DNA-formamidopyrimidine glycosylase/DNA-(apurinic or apyrimidinic site) lyase [Acidimicrobiales bacterium]